MDLLVQYRGTDHFAQLVGAPAICRAEWSSLLVPPCDPFIKHLAVLNSKMDSNCFTVG